MRSFTRADLDKFYDWRNDPYVARFQGWPLPYSRDRANDSMVEMETATPGIPGQWYQIAITKKDTAELIGDCAFCPRQSGIQTEIGYTLARPYHGYGYATQAVRGLVNYLFDQQKMHRISAYCDTRNSPSFKLLQKLGFRLEGHYIENYKDGDMWASEYHYAMLRREWEASG